MNEHEHPHCPVSFDELRHDEEQMELDKYESLPLEIIEQKLREAVDKSIGEMADLDNVWTSIAELSLPEEVSLINAYHNRDYTDIGRLHFQVLTKFLRSRLEAEVMRQIADERDLT